MQKRDLYFVCKNWDVALFSVRVWTWPKKILYARRTESESSTRSILHYLNWDQRHLLFVSIRVLFSLLSKTVYFFILDIVCEFNLSHIFVRWWAENFSFFLLGLLGRICKICCRYAANTLRKVTIRKCHGRCLIGITWSSGTLEPHFLWGRRTTWKHSSIASSSNSISRLF